MDLLPDLVKELRELQRRVRELERANPLQRASAHDGTYTRVEVGEFSHPVTAATDFGLLISRDDGRYVQAIGNEGVIYPVFEIGGVYNTFNDDTNSVTAGAFTGQYAWRLTGWQGSVLRATFTAQTPASTEMDIRVTEAGGASTNTVTLPQNSNVNMQLRWDLTDESLDGSWDGSSSATEAIFTIEAFRSSGSGTCTIFRPSRVAIGSPTLLTGNPSASALASS